MPEPLCCKSDTLPLPLEHNSPLELRAGPGEPDLPPAAEPARLEAAGLELAAPAPVDSLAPAFEPVEKLQLAAEPAELAAA